MRRAIHSGFIILIAVQFANAGLKSKALKEATEYVMRKFGREATEELGADAASIIAKRIEILAAKHGEKVTIEAARKVGPTVFRLVEEVGEEGAPHALKLMARRGDDALWVVTKPKRMAIFVKHGDDAADALIRHREIAEPLIGEYGKPMTKALSGINGQNGRRLAMLAEEGTLSRISNRDAFFDVVGRHGDEAMDWVWRNKGSITTVGVITAFLSDPKPFIDGTVEIIDIGGEKVIRPVAMAAAQSINWNLAVAVFVGCGALLVATRVIFNRAKTAAVRAARRSTTGAVPETKE